MNKANIDESSLIFFEGLNLLRAGRAEDADILFAKAIRLDPNNVNVINLLGIRSYQKQDYKNALAFLNRANSLSPNSVETLSNLGLIYYAIREYENALDFFNAALKVKPDIPEIHNNLGNAYKSLHNPKEAKNSYLKAIALRPHYSEALSNYATLLLEEGEVEQAIKLFKDSIQVNPNFSTAFNNLGNALTQIEQYQDAFSCFERAIQIRPDYLDAHLNYGHSLRKSKHYKPAIECLKRSLIINERSDEAHYALGETYYENGEFDEARSHYRKCLDIAPKNLKARHALAVAQLPKVYQSCEEILSSRINFTKELEVLETLDNSSIPGDIVATAISRHPFYIAYQAENNEPLLSRYGAICHKEAKAIQPEPKPYKPHPHDKIRIGIISNYFCDHPVWHAITKGMVLQIDKNKFDVYLFHTNGKSDDQTILAKSRATQFVKCGKSVQDAANIINNSNIDVLIYPEIGMDTTAKALACLRLAPLQIASWGHPETTGLPTIDFFVSGQLLEPQNAAKNYREELICLPNLGTYVEDFSSETNEFNLGTLEINSDLPILLCPGSPSKYSPETDYIFLEITKQIGKCQLIFFNFEESLTALLKKRLHNIFIQNGLPPNDYIHFVPFLKSEEFNSLMCAADLYLDTIGFSGFNTALKAISCNLPIITIDGPQMRGRLASAILKRMDLGQYICNSNESYIELTVQLIKNHALRTRYRGDIAKSKQLLFNDLEPIRQLEEFLISHTKNIKQC
jgi:protein O-GlcNAc transferase